MQRSRFTATQDDSVIVGVLCVFARLLVQVAARAARGENSLHAAQAPDTTLAFLMRAGPTAFPSLVDLYAEKARACTVTAAARGSLLLW
jgi:hypothetical protein